MGKEQRWGAPAVWGGALVVLLLGSPRAEAIPPAGATEHPTGLWRLPTGKLPEGDVLWLDAQNRAVVNLGTGVGHRCVDYSQDPPVVGAALPYAAPATLAVAAGRDAAFMVQTTGTTLTVWRIDCAATSTVVASAAIDAKYFSTNAIANTIAAEPDGTIYFATIEGVMRFGPATGGGWAATDLLTFAALLPPLRATLPRPVPDSEWTGVVVDAWGLTTPDGALWLQLFPHRPNLPPTASALGRVRPGGSFELVSGLRQLATIPLSWDQATQAVVLSDATLSVRGAAKSHVAFVPTALRQALPADQLPPWPMASELLGARTPTSGHLVPTGDGRLVALTTRGLETLGVDPDLADFDGDGLLLGEETAQGTSDLDADTDGDGVLDGLEVHALASDPRDAGSGPVPEANRVKAAFGPSTRIAAWPWLDLVWTLPADAAGQAMCKATQFNAGFGGVRTPKAYNCMDADGGMLRDVDFPGMPTVTPDGKDVFINDATSVSRWDRATGQTVTFPALLYRTVWALGRDLAFADYSPQLVRFGAAGTQFNIFDESRPCHVAGTAAQGQACLGALKDPTIFLVRVVGYDQDRGRLFIVVTSQYREFLATVGEGEVEFLMDASQFKDGQAPVSIRRWPGHPGFVTWSKGESYVLRDENFAVVQRGGVEANALDGFFRGGFVVEEGVTLLLPVEQTSGPDCKSAQGEAPLCTGVYPPPSYEVRVASQFAQWVPVPLELEPGESLLFANELRDSLTGTGSRDHRTLWRVTRAGAILPWLSAEALVALADPAGQAALAQQGFEVRSLAVAPDLRHVCLAEPANQRLWELELDAQRRPTRLALVDSAQKVAGCAYRPDGGLVKLLDQAGQARVLDASSSTLLPGLSQPLGLARHPGGLIAWGASGNAVCLSDSGVVGVTSRVVLGLGMWGARVMWLDDAGRVGVQGVDAFCAGGLSGEPLVDESSDRIIRWNSNIWTWLYVSTGHTAFAMQPGTGMIQPLPGGDVLLAAHNPVHVGVEPGMGDHVYHLLFRLRPTYAALAAPGRDPALDPLRRATALVSYASLHATAVTCGATVPGDAELVPDDWATLGVPPPVTAEPDAGQPSPPPPKPIITPVCGCSEPGGPALLWLAVMGLMALGRAGRSRRSRSRGAP